MSTKLLLMSRDGTLIDEPAEGRVDTVEKVRLVPGVVPALLELSRAGFELVIVSNQEGLGTPDYPLERFNQVQSFIEALFASQGIVFQQVLLCPHDSGGGCDCRKPAVGLVREYLRGNRIDREQSFMVGDRDSDLQFAENIGIRAFKLDAQSTPDIAWSDVRHRILDSPRIAEVARRTRETDIKVRVDLDGSEEPRVSTGIGFFDHMLDQLGKHGRFGLTVECRGDLHVDEHHTIEDVAICIGDAVRRALGDKRGITRYGFVLPMDEAQADVAIDLGGRSFITFDGTFPRDEVGGMPTELVEHFFRSFANALGATIQIRVSGENTHHMIEACFKGVAKSLQQAIKRDSDSLPSTKGSL